MSTDDLEAYTLKRVREVVGPDMLITASLDLHGNISPEMVEQAERPDQHASPAGDAVDESVGLGRRGGIHARVVTATPGPAKSDRRKP